MKKVIIFVSIITIISGFIAGYLFIHRTPSPFIIGNNSPQTEKTSDVDDGAETVTLSFAGDVLMAGNVEKFIDRNGTDSIFSGVKPVLESSDVSVINLESPISSRGIPDKEKQYAFRSNPESVNALVSGGIDIAVLSNNHILDYGLEAFNDTFDILNKNSVEYIGAGENIAKASAPVYVKNKDLTIAFLASSHVIPYVSWTANANTPGVASTYNPSKLISEIAEARKNADIVVVYVHWGEEAKETPLDYQKNLARMYIDNGADVVIGSHPHVLQGVERYKNGIIAYSLGNFVFTDLKKDTMIFQVVIKDKKLYHSKIIPCQIKTYCPVVIDDKQQAISIFNKIESLSDGIKIDENGFIE